MTFFKYFAGFFALNMAKDVLDEYTSGTGIGYQGSGNASQEDSDTYINGKKLSDHDAWLESKGLLNIDGTVNREAAYKFLGKPNPLL